MATDGMAKALGSHRGWPEWEEDILVSKTVAIVWSKYMLWKGHLDLINPAED